MKRLVAFAVAVIVFAWANAATAQEIVHFPSLEDNGPGQPSTTLDGYLFRPPGEGARLAESTRPV